MVGTEASGTRLGALHRRRYPEGVNEFTIPKRRVDATVVLAGGGERRVTLFLAGAAPGGAGAERLSDLLGKGAEFVPALDAHTGSVAFLAAANVMTVRADAAAEAAAAGAEGEAEALTIPTEHDVEVTLSDGRLLHGIVAYVRPANRGRLVDHLNDGAPFLVLESDDEVLFVNKRHVTRLAIVDR